MGRLRWVSSKAFRSFSTEETYSFFGSSALRRLPWKESQVLFWLGWR